MKPGLSKYRFVVTLAALGVAGPAWAAGVTVFKDGARYVKMGGRIQLQYHSADPDDGDKTDEVFFRRLRPYIEGSLYDDWKAKFQFDFGKASGDNEVSVKDAYFQYTGFEKMKVTVGNKKFPFSREALTSSKKQQLVERTFVGDHNYGVPDRNVGIHLAGHSADKRIVWGAAFASSSIDPDRKKLDFDTPVNKHGDFNEGWIYGARIDFQPFGMMKYSQGDFSGDRRLAAGAGVFRWTNDDDNNTHTIGGVDDGAGKPDVDEVTGVELSAAFRQSGFSVDTQYNLFSADTVDSSFTGGLYTNGDTDLENWAIEGGYMVKPGKLEIVASFESQDADGYDDRWTRKSIGANWFFHKHDAKVQLTYRIGENIKGVNGSDENELYLQGQFVF